jgi:hypothetical protein
MAPIPVVFKNDLAVTAQAGQSQCGTMVYAIVAAILQIMAFVLLAMGLISIDIIKLD